MSFELYNKYTVVSNKDLDCLSGEDYDAFQALLYKVRVIRRGRSEAVDPEYIVLKKDTPEYHAGLAALMLRVGS